MAARPADYLAGLRRQDRVRFIKRDDGVHISGGESLGEQIVNFFGFAGWHLRTSCAASVNDDGVAHIPTLHDH